MGEKKFGRWEVEKGKGRSQWKICQWQLWKKKEVSQQEKREKEYFKMSQ